MIPHSRPWITESDKAATLGVLSSKMISSGRRVKRFESELSDYYGGGFAKTTSSGRQAIALALLLFDVGPGDEVIIPTYVCESVAASVISIGATPVLADCGEGWSICKESIKEHLTNRTKAVVVAHIFGVSANLDSILELNIPVVEDCAQAFGLTETFDQSEYSSKVISIFSFNATKCLTTGEGGAILVRDSCLKLKVDELIAEFSPSSISDLQAALGISQLNRYKEFLERRRLIAHKYFRNIDEQLLSLLHVNPKSMYFRFPLKVDKPVPGLINQFANYGISARRGVDSLLHRKMNMLDSKFKNSVDRFDHTLSIPILPDLTESEINNIVDAINNICLNK